MMTKIEPTLEPNTEASPAAQEEFPPDPPPEEKPELPSQEEQLQEVIRGHESQMAELEKKVAWLELTLGKLQRRAYLSDAILHKWRGFWDFYREHTTDTILLWAYGAVVLGLLALAAGRFLFAKNPGDLPLLTGFLFAVLLSIGDCASKTREKSPPFLHTGLLCAVALYTLLVAVVVLRPSLLIRQNGLVFTLYLLSACLILGECVLLNLLPHLKQKRVRG